MALQNPSENALESFSENDVLYKISQVQNYPQDAKEKVENFMKETNNFS